MSFPYTLRFLFASPPVDTGQVLGIVYRAIATHLIHKAGYTRKTVHTSAVTLIQRFANQSQRRRANRRPDIVGDIVRTDIERHVATDHACNDQHRADFAAGTDIQDNAHDK